MTKSNKMNQQNGYCKEWLLKIITSKIMVNGVALREDTIFGFDSTLIYLYYIPTYNDFLSAFLSDLGFSQFSVYLAYSMYIFLSDFYIVWYILYLHILNLLITCLMVCIQVFKGPLDSRIFI